MTTRDLSAIPPIWTGDVWKVVPILQEYRPDLKLKAFDAATTGLLAISGLDPAAPEPSFLDEALERYRDCSLHQFGLDRFFDLLPFSDAQREIDAGFPLVAHLDHPDICLGAPTLITP